ncbi:hypothetical protein PRIPAC_84824 [Pristionchus pacificus]|uniref:TIR domain-containing protein n=1 Tax=Pristionchus pacificus TaxID=54126 RepID=A0A2A6BTI7_PRIPA|nr:hypothetical protein PRIPAC_84824 [Pristionchus pacificus]|eukprot:PDM69177.1 hypothetical protein PRIPAC_47479 [Pristionchus pacificus]
MKLLLWSPLLLLLVSTAMVVADFVDDDTREYTTTESSVDEGEEGKKVGLRLPSCLPFRKKEKFDVFISYRRDNGQHLAATIKDKLKAKGFNDMDMDDPLCRNNEGWLKNLDDAVEASNNVIPLLTNFSIRPQRPGQMHREIRLAFAFKKNIIPVYDHTFNINSLNTDNTLPRDMCKLADYDALPWNTQLRDATVKLLVDKIKLGNNYASQNNGK